MEELFKSKTRVGIVALIYPKFNDLSPLTIDGVLVKIGSDFQVGLQF